MLHPVIKGLVEVHRTVHLVRNGRLTIIFLEESFIQDVLGIESNDIRFETGRGEKEKGSEETMVDILMIFAVVNQFSPQSLPIESKKKLKKVIPEEEGIAGQQFISPLPI